MLIKSVVTSLAALAALTVSACEGGPSGRVPPVPEVGGADGADPPKVTLTGIAQSCHPGMPIRLVGIRGVNVSAFQVGKVPSLMLNLKGMDTITITDEAAMIRMDTLSRRAYRLGDSSTALARVVSDSSGTFRLTFPATDSVVVYAIGHDEDTPFDHAYKTMSGRANLSFVLDMAHGGCNPLPTN